MDLSSTIFTIQALHTLFAGLGGPHWLMNDADARTYASAVANVMRHYPLNVAEKAQDWFNLLVVITSLEGKRHLEGKRKKAQAGSQGPLPAGFGPPPPGTPFFSYAPPSPPSRAAPPAGEPFGPPNPAAGEPVH